MDEIVKKEGEVTEVKAVAPKKDQKKFLRTAKGKKRAVVSIPKGRVYVQCSVNNTIVSVTDQNGNLVSWSSAGHSGFKGPKKATPYAASVVVGKVCDALEPFGMKEVQVFVKGIGSARDSAIRTLNSKGLNVVSIKELTPVPHNGCRPRRPRRV